MINLLKLSVSQGWSHDITDSVFRMKLIRLTVFKLLPGGERAIFSKKVFFSNFEFVSTRGKRERKKESFLNEIWQKIKSCNVIGRNKISFKKTNFSVDSFQNLFP
jgi:hypothetical protein